MQGRLSINRAALKANYAALQSRVGPRVRVAAMVKANAYGCGLEGCASALEDAGAREFFVANLNEALELRTILETPANIYVLAGFDKLEARTFESEDIIPVLNSPHQLAAYLSAPRKREGKKPAILHVDTGMNRLGFAMDEIDSADCAALDLHFIMSHFACADEKDHPLNETQASRFAEIRKKFAGTPASLANSSGIFRSPEYHLHLARPGMALYGLNPTPETTNPMRPVVKLETPILQIRTALKGETCGYGASHAFTKDCTLAIAALGYADGFSRALSNRGNLYWNGKPCPVRGRVSMDLVIVDLTDIPEHQRPHAGDLLEVIGPHQSPDDLAMTAGTISYEILTSLGGRYECRYTD